MTTSTPDALYKKAQRAARNGHADQARELLEVAAAQGHTDAMTWLGHMQVDLHPTWAAASRAAMAWYQRAADAGSGEGHWYLAGSYLPKDQVRGLHHLRQAAALEDPNALYALGQRYRVGKGVAKDAGMALALLIRAHELNCDEFEAAMNQLSKLLDQAIATHDRAWRKPVAALKPTGRLAQPKAQVAHALVLADDAEAMAWLSLAARLEYNQAYAYIGERYGRGQGVPRDPWAALAFDYVGALGRHAPGKQAKVRLGEAIGAMIREAASDV